MKILLINHYAGSTQHGMEYRPYYLAREWAKQGHEVTIVASSFSHLRSKNPEVESVWSEQTIESIRYVWLKGLHYSGNGIKRILSIITFLTLLAFYSRRLAREKPDLVIGSSTYPLDMLIASRIARKATAKLVFEVHDLWPLSPIELGGMSPKHPYIQVMQFAEDFAYRNSDAVVSLLPLAEPYMASRGLAKGRFVCIPNGIDLAEWDGEKKALPSEHASIIHQLKHEGKFLVGYAGSHGISNALDVLLQVAQKLQSQPVAFVLVGHGPLKDELKSQAREMGLENIHFLPAIPKGMIPSFLGQMDALYLGWRRCSLYRFGISPNKLLDYMAAGKPVVHSVEAGNDLVAEAGCGFSVGVEDPEAISKAILKLRSMPPDERESLGQNGRSFVERNHQYKDLARRFVDEVFQLSGGKVERSGREICATDEAIFEWDVLNWSRALPFWRPFIPGPAPEIRALAVGERNGGLSLWLASNGFRTVSSDLQGVTPQARELHQRHGLAELIEYAEADITALPFPDQSFDVVAFKSVLGALRTEEKQQKALHEMCRVLKNGGVLVFAENLKGSPIHQLFRRLFVRWASYWRYPSIEELGRWLNNQGNLTTQSHGFLAAFGRSEWQRRALGHLDRLVSPWIPARMQYIGFGAFRRKL